MKNVKTVALVLFTVTAGVLVFTRTQSAPPSDFRDAVGSGEFDTAIPKDITDNKDIPIPKPAVVESKSADIAGGAQYVQESFAKLERLYESGRIPTMKEFTGMKIGREFPNYGQTYEAVFLGAPRQADSGAGPIDGDSDYYNPAFAAQRGACDIGTRKDMEKELKKDSPAPNIWRTSGEMAVSYRDDGVTYRFRMAGNYLLMKKTRGIDNSYSIFYFYKDCPAPKLAERIKGEIQQICEGVSCAIKDVKEGLEAAKAERDAAKAAHEYEKSRLQSMDRGHMR